MTDNWEEPDPDFLRAAVGEVADRPLDRGPDIATMTEYVRGRRRRRALAQAGGATTAVMAVVAVAVAVAQPFGGSGTRSGAAPGTKTKTAASPNGPVPSSGDPSAGGSAATQLQPDRPGVVCGQKLTARYEPAAPAGVKAVVAAVHPKPGAAPEVDVDITAISSLTVSGSAHQLGIQVVVLHDGVIVDRIGGSQWPEDFTPQPGQHYGDGLEARSWPVAPGQPHIEQIVTSRWTACAGADWRAIYADPGQYKLVALLPMLMVLDSDGPVSDRVDTLLESAPVAVGQ
ncbi:hypothetical protein GCM10009839_12570 [Catenulispora yoronensis]|uniref:Uncharacterized protein n=1 Tax=Catenulispora yoronensis TaxID=450799 RepID=A0ABN2TQX0_9ACTN